MNVVIVGASGLLGTMLVPALVSAGYRISTVGRAKSNDFICDISDSKAVNSLFNELQPDIVINLVALTNVDICESDPKLAFSVNVYALENIVAWIESTRQTCHLLQISTDQVYDGTGPHSEGSVMLSNYYAFSKYTAELVALRTNSTILRTNFIGKSQCDKRLSFTDWIYKSLLSDREIVLFNDVFFSPLAMETLAEIICKVIHLKPCGIFNLGSRSGLSKSELGLLFAENLQLPTRDVKVTSIEDVDFIKAYRPKDMRMNVGKLEQYLHIQLPELVDEINKVSGDYHEKT
tara:strand:- start:74 stop:946 length:873 start_codon:yes stop_codon:yes gene_type:complete